MDKPRPVPQDMPVSKLVDALVELVAKAVKEGRCNPDDPINTIDDPEMRSLAVAYGVALVERDGNLRNQVSGLTHDLVNARASGHAHTD